MVSPRTSSSRIFWGLLLIVLGFLLLLDRMGRLDFGDLISLYWPLLLIFGGIWHLVTNRFRNSAGGLILIILGCLFMLGKWQILGRSAWHFFWPVLIILAGLWLILGALFRGVTWRSTGEKSDEIDEFAMFSGSKRRLESQAFRGGKAAVVLGRMELDFGQSRLAGEQTSIEATSILGRMEIKVPKTWQVELEAHPVLGSVDSKHSFVPGSEAPPTLRLKARAILGTVEIKESL
ncbi:MAG: LiaF transmembrane domain-containing protein [Candidatus Aminicenantales bacterium]